MHDSSKRARLRSVPLVVGATALALAAMTGLAPADAAGHHHGHGQSKATAYAFRAVSFGTRVRGGSLPAASGTTAYQGIGCTNQSGTTKTNEVATVSLPGLGEVDGVTASSGTEGSGDNVAAFSTHDIAKLTLAQSSLGSLTIKAISSTSRAYHDAAGYHADATVNLGSISLVPTSGPAVDLPLPTPGNPISIPGLLTITLGKVKKEATSGGAIAKAEGLTIEILPTNTKIQVAHTAAKLAPGIKRGLFAGKANATQVAALDDLVHSGPQPLLVLPCQGTNGATRGKAVAAVNVPGLLQVEAASSRVEGSQSDGKASGYTLASIASANVANGALVINAITAKAHVVRSVGSVSMDDDGTAIGSVTLNGQPFSLEALNGLEIPGLLKVETNIVNKSASGIDVVAVRITLLNGTGAVIDLGHAFMSISPAGLPKPTSHHHH
jgi:hypothetical protein